MRLFLTFVLSCSFIGSFVELCSSHKIVKRVVNGAPASRVHFPWVVSVGARLDIHDEESAITPCCTGTIITEVFVVTAAHCFRNCTGGEDYPLYVTTGLSHTGDETNKELLHIVCQAHLHPKYNEYWHKSGREEFDIMLLELKQPLTFTKGIHRIKMARSNYTPNGIIEFAGWGWTSAESGHMSNTLLSTQMHISDPERCSLTYNGHNNRVIDSSVFCALGEGTTACSGDSGAGAICTINGSHALCGVLSYNSVCNPNFPVVFLSVPAIDDWISEKVEKQLKGLPWWGYLLIIVGVVIIVGCGLLIIPKLYKDHVSTL